MHAVHNILSMKKLHTQYAHAMYMYSTWLLGFVFVPGHGRFSFPCLGLALQVLFLVGKGSSDPVSVVHVHVDVHVLWHFHHTCTAHLYNIPGCLGFVCVRVLGWFSFPLLNLALDAVVFFMDGCLATALVVCTCVYSKESSVTTHLDYSMHIPSTCLLGFLLWTWLVVFPTLAHQLRPFTFLSWRSSAAPSSRIKQGVHSPTTNFRSRTSISDLLPTCTCI